MIYALVLLGALWLLASFVFGAVDASFVVFGIIMAACVTVVAIGGIILVLHSMSV